MNERDRLLFISAADKMETVLTILEETWTYTGHIEDNLRVPLEQVMALLEEAK